MATARVPIPFKSETQEDLNPFRIAMRQFDTAAEKCNLDPGMREVLRRPRRALSLSLPVKMDNGSIRVFGSRQKFCAGSVVETAHPGERSMSRPWLRG
jgi:hypothetical protein